MEAHEFLLQFMAILVGAQLLGSLAQRFNTPRVIGEITAGIILGPSLFGWIEPGQVFHLLAEFGIILLLFEVGLETDVSKLIHCGGRSATVAVGGVVAPFALGFGASYLVFGLPLLVAMFVGGTLTATSIGITVRVLTDLRREQSLEAQVVLGAAVLDDIVGVILLALLYQFSVTGEVDLANAGKVSLFIGAFMVLAPVTAKGLTLFIKSFHHLCEMSDPIPTILVSLVLFFSWLAHVIGAPELLGGFAAGLALSRRFFLPFGLALHEYHQECYGAPIAQRMRPLIRLFTPIFFVTVGLSLNLKAVDWGSPFIWVFSIIVFALAVAGKLVGAFLIRESPTARWAIGLAMVPRGEVGLIFAELGRSSGIFDNSVYAGMVLVIALTTLLAPFIMEWFYLLYGARLEGPGPDLLASECTDNETRRATTAHRH